MIFIDNKYTRWYFAIVEQARATPFTGYTEKHHIVPRSLGGDDSPENIVRLTARAHFVVHRLLTKMTHGTARQKMVHALWAMSTLCRESCQDRHKLNALQYESVRKAWAEHMSENNPMHDADTQRRRIESWRKARAANGWSRRKLRKKFVTPIGVFRTKKDFRDRLGGGEWVINGIFNNLDAFPVSNNRRSKILEAAIPIDHSKTWRENGFDILPPHKSS